MGRILGPAGTGVVLLAVMGLAGSVLFEVGCGAVSPPVPESTPATKRAEVYTLSEVSSGLVGGIDFSGGEHAYVFGGKAADQTVSSLKALVLLDSANNLYEAFFDELGLPTRFTFNGQSWTVVYDISDLTRIHKATVSGDGGTADIELPDGFNQIFQALQSGAFSSNPVARGVNAQTAHGVVEMGFGMLGFVALTAVELTPMGALFSVAAMTFGVADGAFVIGTSLWDRPPTQAEQNVGNAISIGGILAGAPSLISTTEKFVTNVPISAFEKLDVIGQAVSRINDNGELQGDARQAADAGSVDGTSDGSTTNGGGTVAACVPIEPDGWPCN